MSDLVRALTAIQQANGWTDEQMARCLGCGRPLWAGVRLGKLSLSKRVLGRVAQEFPLLRDAVVAYLIADTEPESTTDRREIAA